MRLEQAREISRLSTAPSDGCTFAPDLGFRPMCEMHDHLLQHFVTFTDKLNNSQIAYMLEQKLHNYVTWAESRGKYGTPLTRRQVDHLFREALDEKKDDSPDWIRKAWYWLNRNIYYFGVATWRRIKR